MYELIDISKHQQGANLAEAVNDGVDGFIFRLGYGDNETSQDDTCYFDFIEQAESLNKPWGAYIFSYAINEENVKSEIEHTLRLIAGRNPSLGVWWDLENSDYKERNGFEDLANADLVVAWANEFISAMNDNGYIAGLYCDFNHARNLDLSSIEHLWLAAYFDNPDFDNPPCDCDIWQYTSSKAISGVADRVDTNVVYAQWIKDAINNDDSYEADDNVDVDENADVNINSVNFYYAVRAGGTELPEVHNLEDYAGIRGQSITDVKIRCDVGWVEYAVHVLNGDWLPMVTGCDWDDDINGYAGNHNPIDAICVVYHAPDGSSQKAQYHVSAIDNDYYDWQYNNETGDGQDGYAGAFGNAIDRFQLF